MTSKRFGERQTPEKLNGTQDYTGWLICEQSARKLFNDTARRARRAGMLVEIIHEKWGQEGKCRRLRAANCATLTLTKMHAQKQFWTVLADQRDNAGLPQVDLEIHNYAE